MPPSHPLPKVAARDSSNGRFGGIKINPDANAGNWCFWTRSWQWPADWDFSDGHQLSFGTGVMGGSESHERTEVCDLKFFR